jgi:hypothetical protein
MDGVYCVHDHWVCGVCYLPCVTVSVLDLARECIHDAGNDTKIEAINSTA